MPYRVDLRNAAADAFDRLVELGAIDAEPSGDGGISAVMPDSVAPHQLEGALRVAAGDMAIFLPWGATLDSVWVLGPRPIRIGRLPLFRLTSRPSPGPSDWSTPRPSARGSTHAAMCLEALEEAVEIAPPDGVLDVGTGSGILALGALMMGVPRAHGIDIEDEALRVAAENARIDALDQRLQLTRGGPEALTETWPLVLANVLPGPLIEMAPALARRVGHHGQLVLSGIPSSVEYDVDQLTAVWACDAYASRRERAGSRSSCSHPGEACAEQEQSVSPAACRRHTSPTSLHRDRYLAGAQLPDASLTEVISSLRSFRSLLATSTPAGGAPAVAPPVGRPLALVSAAFTLPLISMCLPTNWLTCPSLGPVSSNAAADPELPVGMAGSAADGQRLGEDELIARSSTGPRNSALAGVLGGPIVRFLLDASRDGHFLIA